MIILLDMNISPRWVDYLRARGIDAVHWSTVGDVCAEDRVIMAWAREHDHVVLTNDLDFTTLLAASGASGHQCPPVAYPKRDARSLRRNGRSRSNRTTDDF